MKLLSIFLRVVNVLVLVLLCIFVLAGSDAPCWNILGILMILVYLLNIFVAYSGGIHPVFDYLYLMIIILVMIFLPIYNYGRLMAATFLDMPAWPSFFMVMLPFIMGIVLPRPGRQEDRGPLKVQRKIFTAIFPAIPFIIFLIIALLGGISLVSGMGNWFLSVFISQFAGFFTFIVFASGAVAAKLLKRWQRASVLVLGCSGLIALIFLLPILISPFAMQQAEQSFINAFKINTTMAPDVKQKKLRRTRFSIPEYFLAPGLEECVYEHDIIFYRKKGTTLKFDVYLPEAPEMDSPPLRAALIRVHGGAWVLGDKGAENDAAMNVYFANQGYVVFDIQYGLNDQNDFIPGVKVNSDVKGPFTIDDMIGHLGAFLDYLVIHAADYAVDTSAVFISGGSAGGHLITALALASTNAVFSGLVNPGIQFRGVIPFYPANGLAGNFDITGTRELIDPQQLLSPGSPAFLIYQGTHDSLVGSQRTLGFADAYRTVTGNPCAVLMMPLAGHGSDVYYYGYYNQIFLYYMERFMLLNR